ncbi:MAG: SPFH domain-containing protein [Ruminococcus sp.]
MGLIKAGLGAVGGTLADQWKEFFYCDAIDKNTLVVKGQKRISGRSSNTKGNDNIISNGSGIAVADGQCMIIVEQGKIVEVCAEPGEFTYDSSTEPSIFSGSLGKSIIDTFKTIGKRFAYGGDPGKDQRVYYFNLKEITDNKFGTANPIPFRVVVDESLGFKLSVDLRCNGVFSYKLVNPLLFYTNVCGNVSEAYDRSEIDSMLKGELMNALQPALAKIAAQKIMYYEISAHTKEVSQALKEELKSEWTEMRGIEVFSIAFNSVTVPEDQRKKITEWEETAMTTNPMVAGSRLVGAQADAMKTAAGNPNGAMAGFMGMGMAMNAGGMNAQSLFGMGQQQQQQPQQTQPQQPQAQGWSCSCGTVNQGKFCTNCGSPQPQEGWTCSCGTVNQGKFCQNCGKPKPAGAPLYRCDKCGWTPEDPHNPPKFCPECGDIFDDNDIQQ